MGDCSCEQFLMASISSNSSNDTKSLFFVLSWDQPCLDASSVYSEEPSVWARHELFAMMGLPLAETDYLDSWFCNHQLEQWVDTCLKCSYHQGFFDDNDNFHTEGYFDASGYYHSEGYFDPHGLYHSKGYHDDEGRYFVSSGNVHRWRYSSGSWELECTVDSDGFVHDESLPKKVYRDDILLEVARRNLAVQMPIIRSLASLTVSLSLTAVNSEDQEDDAEPAKQVGEAPASPATNKTDLSRQTLISPVAGGFSVSSQKPSPDALDGSIFSERHHPSTGTLGLVPILQPTPFRSKKHKHRTFFQWLTRRPKCASTPSLLQPVDVEWEGRVKRYSMAEFKRFTVLANTVQNQD